MTDENAPETIRLDQFLKLASVCGTGGQAKTLIQAGEIMVNGRVETKRRRKLQPGDIVIFGDEQIIVECESD